MFTHELEVVRDL